MVDTAAKGPHLVAWNLTTRCNLDCPHCYQSAGDDDAHDLPLDACLRIVDEVLEASPAPMLVLTGGEPLLRRDLESVVHHAAAGGATVVVGTNGTGLTEERLADLVALGVRGFAVSIDSLDPQVHDAFRGVRGALRLTLAAVERMRSAHVPFVVQTTLSEENRGELASLAAWAEAAGAVAFNLYLQVETGRASGAIPVPAGEVDTVARELVALERQYRGRLMVRSKCQPHVVRHVIDDEPDSPLLARGASCPAGLWYCRITPDGKVTPCPYLPVVAGDLTERSFGEIWADSPVFHTLRNEPLGGRCGRCALRAACRGCRARAFAHTGDMLAADETCSREPDGLEPLVPPVPRPVLGMEITHDLRWTEEARLAMERVPSFVRGMVVRRVEAWARRHGVEVVDEALLRELRARMPGHPRMQHPGSREGEA